ncbi:putative glycolipid-binding-domain-containing protein [Aspergillus keveii]|uniref:Glycolipid-binding-domain-containing protein n=1 Tax=Aspergillus keveii TaxID=714993 RepID=A0ABR4G602_9EURO
MADLEQLGRLSWSPLFGGGKGFEKARVTFFKGCIIAKGKIVSKGNDEKTGYLIKYRILLDYEWRKHNVKIYNSWTGEALKELYTDGLGKWFDGDGKEIPNLDNCRDVDIPESTLMKTFPIRRMNLREWERYKTRSASGHVTTSTIEVDVQKHLYSCYDDDWWLFRYEGLTSGFTTDFFTDEEGFVNKIIRGWSFTALYHHVKRDKARPSEHPKIPPRTKGGSAMSLDSDKSEYSDCEIDNLLEDDSDNDVFLDDDFEYDEIGGD